MDIAAGSENPLYSGLRLMRGPRGTRWIAMPDKVSEWPFAPLTGLIQCPTLRRDGSLLDVNGYDECTGLVLLNSLEVPPIAASPSREDAEAALELLTGLIEECHFVDQTSRAVALSMILTPVLRAAREVAPMHLVTAPLAGTGKSYLADIVAMIATGDRCAVKAASPDPENEPLREADVRKSRLLTDGRWLVIAISEAVKLPLRLALEASDWVDKVNRQR
jgi:hypothetical protein